MARAGAIVSSTASRRTRGAVARNPRRRVVRSAKPRAHRVGYRRLAGRGDRGTWDLIRLCAGCRPREARRGARLGRRGGKPGIPNSPPARRTRRRRPARTDPPDSTSRLSPTRPSRRWTTPRSPARSPDASHRIARSSADSSTTGRPSGSPRTSRRPCAASLRRTLGGRRAHPPASRTVSRIVAIPRDASYRPMPASPPRR